MCNEIMRTITAAFHPIPDSFKTQEMCKKAVEIDPSSLQLVPKYFNMQEICDKAVRDDFSTLQYGPDWCVTWEGLYMWHDDYYDDDGNYWAAGDDDDDEKNFMWYNGYKKRKGQKAQTNEELLHIAWHPNRVMDW